MTVVRQTMQLDFAFLCSFASYLHDNRSVVIGAGVDGIEGAGFPFAAQLSLMARLLAPPGEAVEEHVCRIDLTSPQRQRTRLCEDVKIVAGRDDRYPQSPAVALVVMNLRVEFREAGEHFFHLVVDDTEMKRIDFRVSPTAAAQAV